MEILRMKWCEELEQLLECPVCYERLVGNIYFCEGGHNICSSCVRRLCLCVVCTRPYTKTRNFLAEHISEKMDSIKAALSNPNDPINNFLNFDKICMGTQTDFDPLFSRDLPTKETSTAVSHNPPIVPWGVYPCWIGFECKFRGPYRKLFDHLKFTHSSDFDEEFCSEDMPYAKTWNVKFGLNVCVSRVFQIPNVGLFVFRINADDTGNVQGHILMYDSGLVARQYKYQMEVHIGGNATFYIGEVDSCRIPPAVLVKKGLFISRQDFSEYFTGESENISIAIVIDRSQDAAAIDKYLKSQNKPTKKHQGKKKAEFKTESADSSNGNASGKASGPSQFTVDNDHMTNSASFNSHKQNRRSKLVTSNTEHTAGSPSQSPTSSSTSSDSTVSPRVRDSGTPRRMAPQPPSRNPAANRSTDTQYATVKHRETGTWIRGPVVQKGPLGSITIIDPSTFEMIRSCQFQNISSYPTETSESEPAVPNAQCQQPFVRCSSRASNSAEATGNSTARSTPRASSSENCEPTYPRCFYSTGQVDDLYSTRPPRRFPTAGHRPPVLRQTEGEKESCVIS